MLENSIHPDLLDTMELLYNPLKLQYSKLQIESESANYGACGFVLNNYNVKFRVAKTTLAKLGQFVTLWKRNNSGIIEPYDMSDNVDLFVISCRQNNNFGQFIFPKLILCKHNIVSYEDKSGKLSFRVYPPWVNVSSKQAKKTQQWQIKYFLDVMASVSLSNFNRLYEVS